MLNFHLDAALLATRLQQEVLYYRQQGYAPTTKKSYRTQFDAFIKFCSMLGLPPLPASNYTLCIYAAFLARFLLPQSVYSYVHFVGILHKDQGFSNPVVDNWPLSHVLKGIRRVHGKPSRPRLPITIDILVALHSRLNFNLSKHASFWAICLTMFFGLFRKSHLLPSYRRSFNPIQQFIRSGFKHDVHGMVLKVRWSKTFHFGQSVVLVPLICFPSIPLCPVTAILHAFALTPAATPCT